MVNGTTRHFVAELYQRKFDSSGTTQEERFRLYAGDRQIAEITRKDSTDQTQYFHPDHLGSPETISDSNGAAYQQHFDPFGAPLEASNPELTRVGFTGHDHDRDLGLIDMKGRVYDPLAGRFLTADPVMQAPYWSQGLNRYRYVFNNPLNNTDPSGFIADGGDYSGVAITGWGAGVTGIAAGIGFSGIGAGALSSVTSAFMPSIGDGSAGSTRSAPAPTAVPKGSALNPQGGGGATGQFGNVGAARRPPPMCSLGMCVAQITPGGEGAPGYLPRTDGTGGGVPVEQSSPILDWLVSRIAPEVTAVINLIVSIEEHRQAYAAQMSGRDVDQRVKKEVRNENRAAHDGELTCEGCGRNDLVDPKRAKGGVPRPENEAQVDHVVPRADGGPNDKSNLRVLCPGCNAPGVIPR